MEKANRWDEEASEVAEHNESLKQEAEQFCKQAFTAESDLESLSQAFANERKERAALVLQSALSDGLILPCERDVWAQRLSEDFESAANELSEQIPQLHTRSETADLKSRHVETTARREAFLLLVNQRRSATGEDYTTAWNYIKRTREDLYGAFTKKD